MKTISRFYVLLAKTNALHAKIQVQFAFFVEEIELIPLCAIALQGFMMMNFLKIVHSVI
jgi:hypothetical protein